MLLSIQGAGGVLSPLSRGSRSRAPLSLYPTTFCSYAKLLAVTFSSAPLCTACIKEMYTLLQQWKNHQVTNIKGTSFVT